MKKLYSLCERDGYGDTHKTYAGSWSVLSIVVLVGGIITTGLGALLTALLPLLAILVGSADFNALMAACFTTVVPVLLFAGGTVAAIGVLANAVYNLPIWRYRRYLRKPTSERRKSKMWFNELRVLDYQASKRVNALIRSFNIHIDRLNDLGIEPGEREQVACDAINALLMSYKDAHANVKISLRAELDGPADTSKAIDALEQLREATGSSEGNILPERIAADLEANTASWQGDGEVPDLAPSNQILSAQRAVAALSQG